jgi:hypothetical protein
MWLSLIKLYWQIAVFKQSPSATPHSPLLLGITGIFFCGLIACQWLISDMDERMTVSLAFLVAGALGVSYFLYTSVLLQLFHRSNRTLQTVTSLFATHAIIHLFTMPLLILTPLMIESGTIQVLAPFVGVLYLALTLFLTIWQLTVTAYLYKHALSIDAIPAFLASLGLLACNILIVSFWW